MVIVIVNVLGMLVFVMAVSFEIKRRIPLQLPGSTEDGTRKDGGGAHVDDGIEMEENPVMEPAKALHEGHHGQDGHGNAHRRGSRRRHSSPSRQSDAKVYGLGRIEG